MKVYILILSEKIMSNLQNNKPLLAGIIISGIIGAIVLGIVLLFAIAYLKKKEGGGKQSEQALKTMKEKYQELEKKLTFKDGKILTRKDVEGLAQDQIDNKLSIFFVNESVIISADECTCTFCTIYIIKKLCVLYFDTIEEEITDDGKKDFKMKASILRKRFPHALEDDEVRISKELRKELKKNTLDIITEYEESKNAYESAEDKFEKAKNQSLIKYITSGDLFSSGNKK